jgi:hypothetical protein
MTRRVAKAPRIVSHRVADSWRVEDLLRMIEPLRIRRALWKIAVDPFDDSVHRTARHIQRMGACDVRSGRA